MIDDNEMIMNGEVTQDKSRLYSIKTKQTRRFEYVTFMQTRMNIQPLKSVKKNLLLISSFSNSTCILVL